MTPPAGLLTFARPADGAAHGLPVVRTHLDRLRGSYGLFQHAHGIVPAPGHGFCTDDVARALSLDLRHMHRQPAASIHEDIRADLGFLEAAFVAGTGRFRNLRASDGAWLEGIGSEDCHGRAIGALADAIRLAPDLVIRERAAALLARALPAVTSLRHLRPLAYTAAGCVRVAQMGRSAAYLPGGPGGAWGSAAPLAGGSLDTVWPAGLANDCRELAILAATRIAEAGGWDRADWPWPEEVVAYEAPVVPAALIVAGHWSGELRWLDKGLQALRWLADAEVTASGLFQPIGNRGWWHRGGRPATDDAQPIEAASMIAAAAEAWRVTRDDVWLRIARRAWGWFLGDNAAGRMVADPADGSCHDGLGPDGLNRNRGAESTLAWLASVETMAALGAPGAASGTHRALAWSRSPTARR